MSENEIAAKIPEGFRKFTDDEEREIKDLSFKVALFSEKAARYQAEQDAAKMHLKDSLSNLATANDQFSKFNEKIGVKSERDVQLINGVYYVREEIRTIEKK